jgi:hypothetical protein
MKIQSLGANSAIMHTSPLHFFIFSTNHKHHAFKTNQNQDIVLAPHNLGLHININFKKIKIKHSGMHSPTQCKSQNYENTTKNVKTK